MLFFIISIKIFKLTIINIALTFQQSHTIVDLITETMCQIVNYDHIFEVSVCKNPQILYNKAIFGVHGHFISEKSSYYFAGVNVIDDRFGIGFG